MSATLTWHVLDGLKLRWCLRCSAKITPPARYAEIAYVAPSRLRIRQHVCEGCGDEALARGLVAVQP